MSELLHIWWCSSGHSSRSECGIHGNISHDPAFCFMMVFLDLSVNLKTIVPRLSWLWYLNIFDIAMQFCSIMNFGDKTAAQDSFQQETASIAMLNAYGKWAFPCGSGVKNLPTVQKTWVWSQGQGDPVEKKMATHSSILDWAQRVEHNLVTIQEK